MDGLNIINEIFNVPTSIHVNDKFGRKRGRKFLHTRPKLEGKLNHVTTWIERYPILLMIFYRFMYGIRIKPTLQLNLFSENRLRV